MQHHTIRHAAAAALLALAALGASDALAQPGSAPASSAAAIDEAGALKQISGIAGQRESTDAELATLRRHAEGGSATARAYALALLYRQDKPARAALLPRMQAVFQYRTPAGTPTGEYKAFTGSIERIEANSPEPGDKMLTTLLAYLHYREQPMVFQAPDDKRAISAATFMRTAFLTQVFQGSDVDVTEFLELLRTGAPR